MAEERKVRVHNKSDKPDNVVARENEIFEECENIENKLDAFRTVSQTAKSVHLTVIAANGLADNAYARKAQNVLVVDDLFNE